MVTYNGYFIFLSEIAMLRKDCSQDCPCIHIFLKGRDKPIFIYFGTEEKLDNWKEVLLIKLYNYQNGKDQLLNNISTKFDLIAKDISILTETLLYMPESKKYEQAKDHFEQTRDNIVT